MLKNGCFVLQVDKFLYAWYWIGVTHCDGVLFAVFDAELESSLRYGYKFNPYGFFHGVDDICF